MFLTVLRLQVPIPNRRYDKVDVAENAEHFKVEDDDGNDRRRQSSQCLPRCRHRLLPDRFRGRRGYVEVVITTENIQSAKMRTRTQQLSSKEDRQTGNGWFD